MSKDNEWVRLKRGNDWGVDYYAIEPNDGSGARCSRGIRVTDGEKVSVRWPDGSTSVCEIVLKGSSMEVSDHGHRSTVTSDIPHVAIEANGVRSLVCIDQVDVLLLWAVAHGAK